MNGFLASRKILFLCLIAAAVIITCGCSGLKSRKAAEKPLPAPPPEPTLEEVLEATGFKYEAYRGKVFILQFTTAAGDFPVIVRWNNDKQNYVIIKTVLIGNPDGYQYSPAVLKRINWLNKYYDAVKFAADESTGDITVAFCLDHDLLDPTRLRDMIAALIVIAEKEFAPLWGLVLKEEIQP